MSKPIPEAWSDALRSSRLYHALDSSTLEYMAGELIEKQLASGEVLVRQGDEGDSAYFLVAGELDVVLEQGQEVVIDTLKRGSVVGEIALWLGGERSATVRAREPVTVLELSRTAFDRLIDNNPGLMAPLINVLRARLRTISIAGYLRTIFGELSPDTLHALEDNMEWVHLQSGQMLFRQGDEPDGAYILAVGRLNVAVDEPDGSERVIDETGPGQWIGEMALLTRSTRSATVYATRDSELVRLSHAAFDELIGHNRTALMETTRLLVTRLQRQLSGRRATMAHKTFAVIPIGPDVDVERLSDALTDALGRYGSVLPLTAARVDQHMGKEGIARCAEDHPGNLRLGPWLREQEQDHDYVVYQADRAWSNWSDRALRHADHILLVANASSSPAVTADERRIMDRFAHGHRPRTSLVLIQQPGRVTFPGTRRWLAERTCDAHHHVRRDDHRDIARLARRLTDRAVSLVLGGGGSRGYAHVGVIRALEQLGVPIDAACGTSIGAVVGAGFTRGLRSTDLLRVMQPIFNSLIDPTLPLVSLASGRQATKGTEDVVGTLDIEDLAVPYFAVSTNLSRNCEVIHRAGPLAVAVRASGSLPGIFPPVPYHGDLLVDGGLSDNLPVETMSRLHPGHIIAVDVMPDVELTAGNDLPIHLSGWKVAWNMVNPLRRKIDMPNILNIIIRSVTAASNNMDKAARTAELASLSLKPSVKQWNMLDFKAAPSIAEQGYRSTVQDITAWWHSQRGAILGQTQS